MYSLIITVKLKAPLKCALHLNDEEN